MSKQKTTKKTTSIARRINASFWFKRFFALVFFDALLGALVCGTFYKVCIDKLPEEAHFTGNFHEFKEEDFAFTGTNYQDLEFIMVVDTEKKNELVPVNYAYDVSDFFDYVIPPASILLLFEGLLLFDGLFHTGEIRRKLRPLNDLAVKAEELSKLPMDETSLTHLEEAIMNVSADASLAKIRTGDKDLESIEVALNNLFLRMKESQKQQARFVSDASHELRTPISVIQGYVNMLDRWGKQDENILDESIEALKNESDHMKELVEQLLFLARGDSGRNTLKPVEFDLRQVVQEVWEESMMIDEKHQYSFSQAVFEDMEDNLEDSAEGVEQPKSEYCMVGDVAMIKQSIRIFVQNAAKYSEEGNTIKFAVKQKDGILSYMVQDEGIGMQEKDVVHIFERFYRSDEARNGETGGSGLGLSIAKWIIDAHEGTIDVLSRPEIGTRFTVNFRGTNA